MKNHHRNKTANATQRYVRSRVVYVAKRPISQGTIKNVCRHFALVRYRVRFILFFFEMCTYKSFERGWNHGSEATREVKYIEVLYMQNWKLLELGMEWSLFVELKHSNSHANAQH